MNLIFFLSLVIGFFVLNFGKSTFMILPAQFPTISGRLMESTSNIRIPICLSTKSAFYQQVSYELQAIFYQSFFSESIVLQKTKVQNSNGKSNNTQQYSAVLVLLFSSWLHFAIRNSQRLMNNFEEQQQPMSYSRLK